MMSITETCQPVPPMPHRGSVTANVTTTPLVSTLPHVVGTEVIAVRRRALMETALAAPAASFAWIRMLLKLR